MASVRLKFLLSLGRCDPEMLAEELLIWTIGRDVLGGSDILLEIPTFPVPPATTPVAGNGVLADVVVTAVAVVVVEDVATPTGYIPILWVPSPSPLVDDTVEVPVVPELGDGCL